MKKIFFAFIICLMALGLSARPVSDAKAYAVISAKDGNILYSKNKNAKLKPASLTKVMTALVFIEDFPDVKNAVYTKEAGKTPFGNMYFPAGTVLSKEDALSVMLVSSSNDMARAIALNCAKESEFVSLMNAKAKKIGMKNTHFANVHGLDTAGHYSTAEDLVRLGRYAVKNQFFSKIPKKETTVLLNINGRTKRKKIISTFRDFYSVKGAKGIKTGTTTGAGKCFMGYVEREGEPIVSVVLKSKNPIKETGRLADYTYCHCTEKTVLDANRDCAVTVKGKKVRARPLVPLKIFTDTDNKNISAKFTAKQKFPIFKGEQIGTAELWDGGDFIKKTPLVSQQTALMSDGALVVCIFLIIIFASAGFRFYLKKK